VVQGGAGTWLAMESKGEMMPEISWAYCRASAKPCTIWQIWPSDCKGLPAIEWDVWGW
jgi:hypothetical protein